MGPEVELVVVEEREKDGEAERAEEEVDVVEEVADIEAAVVVREAIQMEKEGDLIVAVNVLVEEEALPPQLHEN